MKLFLGCLRTLLVLLLAAMTPRLSAQPVRLVYPEYPPYTSTVDGKPTGIGVELVRKVMAEAGLSLTVLSLNANYSRCLATVRNGMADGFFLASQNAERDAVAIRTDTLLTVKRVWITPKGSGLSPEQTDFRSKARVGVILNSNPHIWLKDNAYSISITPTNEDALLRALDSGRANAIFAPDLLFFEALKHAKKSADGYKMTVQSESAFAIYLSRKFASRNPDAVKKINAAIRKVVVDKN